MRTETETRQRRRRRVRLTPVRPIPVESTGERAGEGPLTLGRLDCYMWLSRMPTHFYALLCVELPVPGVVSVDDVAEAVAALIARPESLRTSYLPGEQPRQQVAASGGQLLAGRGTVGAAGPPRGSRGAPAVAARVTRPRTAPGARRGGHRSRRRRPGHRVRRGVLAPGGGPRLHRRPQARLHGTARRSRATPAQPASPPAAGPGRAGGDAGRAAQGRGGTGLPARAGTADAPFPVRPAGRPGRR